MTADQVIGQLGLACLLSSWLPRALAGCLACLMTDVPSSKASTYTDRIWSLGTCDIFPVTQVRCSILSCPSFLHTGTAKMKPCSFSISDRQICERCANTLSCEYVQSRCRRICACCLLPIIQCLLLIDLIIVDVY